jgi:uncharacterized protein YutE (UPF0331/DUF86 family)
MTPGTISKRIILDRIAWVETMIAEIRALPLDSGESFLADRRNVWAAESCLRRALEALLDIGRHILAKGFGTGVSEYREIAEQLCERGVLTPEESRLLRQMAGYRNRMVHFYHEVSRDELFAICAGHLGDVDTVLSVLKRWLQTHPEQLDERL